MEFIGFPSMGRLTTWVGGPQDGRRRYTDILAEQGREGQEYRDHDGTLLFSTYVREGDKMVYKGWQRLDWPGVG